jgi:hypothetical protein
MLEVLVVMVLELMEREAGVFLVWLADFVDESYLAEFVPVSRLKMLVNVNSLSCLALYIWYSLNAR